MNVMSNSKKGTSVELVPFLFVLIVLDYFVGRATGSQP